MLQEVLPMNSRDELVLVLDTCGERASVSLHRGLALAGERILAERTASQQILGAVRDLLREQNVSLETLHGLGVVHGPGSFTGVRVGLALAKGLCEAAKIRCASVSRLAVLAHAADLQKGYALLPAGRGHVYVRAAGGVRAGAESMVELSVLLPQISSPGEADAAVAAVEDAGLAESLRPNLAGLRVVELAARHAIAPVLLCLAQGGVDLARLDANYVRDEGAIYRLPAPATSQIHG